MFINNIKLLYKHFFEKKIKDPNKSNKFNHNFQSDKADK